MPTLYFAFFMFICYNCIIKLNQVQIKTKKFNQMQFSNKSLKPIHYAIEIVLILNIYMADFADKLLACNMLKNILRQT